VKKAKVNNARAIILLAEQKDGRLAVRAPTTL